MIHRKKQILKDEFSREIFDKPVREFSLECDFVHWIKSSVFLNRATWKNCSWLQKRKLFFTQTMCMLRYEIIAFSYAYGEVSNTAPRSILRRTVPVLFVHALIPRYKHAKHDKFLQYKSMIISSLFLKSTCFTRRSDLLLTIVLLVTLRKPHRNNIATQTNTSDSNKNKREERRLHFRWRRELLVFGVISSTGS